MKVQHTARLHPESVQKIADGKRRPRKQRSHTTTVKWNRIVNPLAMSVARELVKPGQVIRITTEGDVLIINKKEK